MTVDRIDAELGCANKKGLILHLGAVASRRTGISTRVIAEALAEREKKSSTGFGGGIALPHARIDGLEQPFAFFARLSTPIDYKAVDSVPVDLVLLLLSPADAGAAHLKLLASASRTLRDRATMAKLRGARSRDAIFALLSAVGESQHAA